MSRGEKLKTKPHTTPRPPLEVSTPVEIKDFPYFRKGIPVTTAYTDVMIPFADLMPPSFASDGSMLPATYKPADHMNGIALGVGTKAELLDVYLQNVTFY